MSDPAAYLAGPGAPELVSVIIPTFRRAAMLDAALASLHAQTYRPLEAIVVDGDSNDGTADVVRAWAARAAADGTFSVLGLVQRPNTGASAARNLGLARARGAYIAFLDSDDVALPAKTARQVAALRTNPAASCAYGLTRCLDAAGRVVEIFGRPPPADPVLNAVRPCFDCIGPLWRRAAVRQAGPWDEALTGREDWVFRARALLRSGPSLHLPEVACEKHLHAAARVSRHGSPEFARQCWACMQAVQALISADPRTSAAARTELAAQMSGPFRTLLRCRQDDDAGRVLAVMAALAAGRRGCYYRALHTLWRVAGPAFLHRAGVWSGRL